MADCSMETQIAAACAAGFFCLSPLAAEAVKLYQMRAAAGLSALSPQDLVDAAKCFIAELGTIPAGVEAYLLCQLAGGS